MLCIQEKYGPAKNEHMIYQILGQLPTSCPWEFTLCASTEGYEHCIRQTKKLLNELLDSFHGCYYRCTGNARFSLIAKQGITFGGMRS